MGALAALRYRAEDRNTTDIDLLVAGGHGVLEAFERRGFSVRKLSDTGEEPHMFVATKDEMRIDVIVAETPYQREALDRSENGVLSAEDVVIHKLIAWRPRDRDDVRSILQTGRELDVAYIEKWASEWDVADRWQEARSWLTGSETSSESS